MKKRNTSIQRMHRGLSCWASAILTCVAVATVTAVADPNDEMKDPEITSAVENEILYDSAVPYNDIDVSTKDGIVTLQGTVGNLLAKDRAAILAETVKGVRSVINLVEVKPSEKIKADRLTTDVEQAILDDPATDSYEVIASAKGTGAVTLTGTVDSWQERELCTTVAKSVRGVTSVDNQIEVDWKTNRPDAEIKPEIERRLRWDALVDDAMIEVAVEDGVVTLSGEVGSSAEKRRARADAFVAGVDSVEAEELDVVAWMRDEKTRDKKPFDRGDEKIADAIEDAFLYDPRVLLFEIEPKVSSGWVTLEGQVDNLEAKRSAEQVVRNTVGVLGVTNRIKVRPEEDAKELTDPKIERKLDSRLALDPWVEAYEIDTEVAFGTAHLFGTVGTNFEKSQAESVASRTRGVKEVVNHLEVSDTTDRLVYDPYTWGTSSFDYYPYYPATVDVVEVKPDDKLLEDIRSEIFWSPFVDSDTVTVTVDDGVATLSGTVDSFREKEAATENAFEGGASIVENDLIITN